MINVFGYPQLPELPELELEDDLATVFVSVMALAGSQLAKTGRQQELALYFCTRDVTVLGAGMLGFDVGELPWGGGRGFPEAQAFVQQTCAWAARRLGWERLGYYPPEDRLRPTVKFFQRLVDLLDPAHLEPTDPSFRPMVTSPLEACSVHGIFRHHKGCLLCNTASMPYPSAL